jgi:hypothetical protein
MIMKKLITLALTGALTLSMAFGQSKLTEKDLLGTWKMVIELDEVMAELDKEAKESENLFAEVLLKSVAGVVEGAMERVNIYMEFEHGGRATVMVDAFDEKDNDDEAEWYIKNNRLYIEGTDNFKSDREGSWELRDGVLFLEDNDNEKAKVYMVRVKE